MKKVENISDVYSLANDVSNINKYVGSNKQDIISEELLSKLPYLYDYLINIAKPYGFLAGGALRSLELLEDAKDFDFYAYKAEDRIKLVQAFETSGFTATHYNNNCVSLEKGDILVQVIFSFVGNIADVIDEFDFTICRIGTDGVKIYKDKDFDENLEKKLIRIKTVQCPIGAIRRIIKYTKKGFFVTNYNLLKLYENYIGRGAEYHQQLDNLLTKQESGQNLDQNDLNELYAIMRKVD